MATVKVLSLFALVVFAYLARSIVAPLVVDEIRALLPYLTRKNFVKAILRLPPELRIRYVEEWQSDLREIPGPIAKFRFSLGLPRASARIYRSCGLKRRASIHPLIRRCVDLTFSFLMLTLSAPIFVIIPVLIKLESPGPVFVKYQRISKIGRRFEMLGFRTIQINQSNDCVTRCGAFLRKHSLDVLPRLFNFLKGEMTFTNPDPDRWE